MGKSGRLLIGTDLRSSLWQETGGYSTNNEQKHCRSTAFSTSEPNSPHLTESLFFNWAGAFAAGAVAAVGTNHELERAAGTDDEAPDEAHFVNWSGTHEVTPKRFYQPESVEELEQVVAEAHEKGKELIDALAGAPKKIATRFNKGSHDTLCMF